jgi:hypothetical protein
MTDQWQELLGVLNALVSGRIGLTEGCRHVARLRHVLGQNENELFLPFVGVDSETDSFPLGEVRKQWSAKGLMRADEQRSSVEAHYTAFVMQASEALRAYVIGILPRH